MKEIFIIDSYYELVLEADIYILHKILDLKCQTCRNNLQKIKCYSVTNI